MVVVPDSLRSFYRAVLGPGLNTSSWMLGNLEKSYDHLVSDVVLFSTSFYHVGHILCPHGYKIKSQFQNEKTLELKRI